MHCSCYSKVRHFWNFGLCNQLLTTPKKSPPPAKSQWSLIGQSTYSYNIMHYLFRLTTVLKQNWRPNLTVHENYLFAIILARFIYCRWCEDNDFYVHWPFLDYATSNHDILWCRHSASSVRINARSDWFLYAILFKVLISNSVEQTARSSTGCFW